MDERHRFQRRKAQNRKLVKTLQTLLKPGEFNEIREKGSYSIYSFKRNVERGDCKVSEETMDMPSLEHLYELIRGIGHEITNHRSKFDRLDEADVMERANAEGPHHGLVPDQINWRGSNYNRLKGMTEENYLDPKARAADILSRWKRVAQSTGWIGDRGSMFTKHGPGAEIESWNTGGSSSDITVKLRPVAAWKLLGKNLDGDNLAVEFRSSKNKKNPKLKHLMPMGVFDEMEVDYENLEGVHLFRIPFIHRRLRRVDWMWMATKRFNNEKAVGLARDMEGAMKDLRKTVAKRMLELVEDEGDQPQNAA